MVTHFSGQPRVFGQRGRQLIKRLCAFEKKIILLPGNVYFGACKFLFVSDNAGKKRKKDFPTPATGQKRKKSQSPNLQGSWDSVLECRGNICHHGLWSGLCDLGTRWADLFLTELFVSLKGSMCVRIHV